MDLVWGSCTSLGNHPWQFSNYTANNFSPQLATLHCPNPPNLAITATSFAIQTISALCVVLIKSLHCCTVIVCCFCFVLYISKSSKLSPFRPTCKSFCQPSRFLCLSLYTECRTKGEMSNQNIAHKTTKIFYRMIYGFMWTAVTSYQKFCAIFMQ